MESRGSPWPWTGLLIALGLPLGLSYANTEDRRLATDVQQDAFGFSQRAGALLDEGAVAEAIRKAIAANPAQLAQYRSGKDKVFGFFVGQVMKATQGKANPQLVNDLLKRMLAG